MCYLRSMHTNRQLLLASLLRLLFHRSKNEDAAGSVATLAATGFMDGTCQVACGHSAAKWHCGAPLERRAAAADVED